MDNQKKLQQQHIKQNRKDNVKDNKKDGNQNIDQQGLDVDLQEKSNKTEYVGNQQLNQNIQGSSKQFTTDPQEEYYRQPVVSHSSALNGILKKIGIGVEDIWQHSMTPAISVSKLKGIISKLQEYDDQEAQLTGATELVQELNQCGEDYFEHFKSNELIVALLDVLSSEGNPSLHMQVVLALTYLLDLNTQQGELIVKNGGLESIVKQLACIQYMDVAEQVIMILQKLSFDFPVECLEAGVMNVVLQYMDFFCTAVQRTAAQCAYNLTCALVKDLGSSNKAPLASQKDAGLINVLGSQQHGQQTKKSRDIDDLLKDNIYDQLYSKKGKSKSAMKSIKIEEWSTKNTKSQNERQEAPNNVYLPTLNQPNATEQNKYNSREIVNRKAIKYVEVCLPYLLQMLQNSDEKVAMSAVGALSNIMTGLGFNKDLINNFADIGILKKSIDLVSVNAQGGSSAGVSPQIYFQNLQLLILASMTSFVFQQSLYQQDIINNLSQLLQTSCFSESAGRALNVQGLLTTSSQLQVISKMIISLVPKEKKKEAQLLELAPKQVEDKINSSNVQSKYGGKSASSKRKTSITSNAQNFETNYRSCERFRNDLEDNELKSFLDKNPKLFSKFFNGIAGLLISLDVHQIPQTSLYYVMLALWRLINSCYHKDIKAFAFNPSLVTFLLNVFSKCQSSKPCVCICIYICEFFLSKHPDHFRQALNKEGLFFQVEKYLQERKAESSVKESTSVPPNVAEQQAQKVEHLKESKPPRYQSGSLSQDLVYDREESNNISLNGRTRSGRKSSINQEMPSKKPSSSDVYNQVLNLAQSQNEKDQNTISRADSLNDGNIRKVSKKECTDLAMHTCRKFLQKFSWQYDAVEQQGESVSQLKSLLKLDGSNSLKGEPKSFHTHSLDVHNTDVSILESNGKSGRVECQQILEVIKLLGDTQGEGKQQIDITPFELKNSGAIEKLIEYFTMDDSGKISVQKVQEFAMTLQQCDQFVTSREILLALKKFIQTLNSVENFQVLNNFPNQTSQQSQNQASQRQIAGRYLHQNYKIKLVKDESEHELGSFSNGPLLIKGLVTFKDLDQIIQPKVNPDSNAHQGHSRSTVFNNLKDELQYKFYSLGQPSMLLQRDEERLRKQLQATESMKAKQDVNPRPTRQEYGKSCENKTKSNLGEEDNSFSFPLFSYSEQKEGKEMEANNELRRSQRKSQSTQQQMQILQQKGGSSIQDNAIMQKDWNDGKAQQILGQGNSRNEGKSYLSALKQGSKNTKVQSQQQGKQSNVSQQVPSKSNKEQNKQFEQSDPLNIQKRLDSYPNQRKVFSYDKSSLDDFIDQINNLQNFQYASQMAQGTSVPARISQIPESLPQADSQVQAVKQSYTQKYGDVQVKRDYSRKAQLSNRDKEVKGMHTLLPVDVKQQGSESILDIQDIDYPVQYWKDKDRSAAGEESSKYLEDSYNQMLNFGGSSGSDEDDYDEQDGVIDYEDGEYKQTDDSQGTTTYESDINNDESQIQYPTQPQQQQQTAANEEPIQINQEALLHPHSRESMYQAYFRPCGILQKSHSGTPFLQFSIGNKVLNASQNVFQAIAQEIVLNSDQQQVSQNLQKAFVQQRVCALANEPEVITIKFRRATKSYEQSSNKKEKHLQEQGEQQQKSLEKQLSSCLLKGKNNFKRSQESAIAIQEFQQQAQEAGIERNYDMQDIEDLALESTILSILKLLKVFENCNLYVEQLVKKSRLVQSCKSYNGANFASNRAFDYSLSKDLVSYNLSFKLEQQLKSSFTIYSQALPQWMPVLVYQCPFLFSFNARRLYFCVVNFPLQRSAYLIQSLGVEKQDEGKGLNPQEISSRKLSKQKVRVSRKKILESAFKIFQDYSKSNSLLEIEYFNEPGTGLGPTLEFFTILSYEFQLKRGKLWRDDNAYLEKNDSTSVHDSNQEKDNKEVLQDGKEDYISLQRELVFSKTGLFPRPLSQDLSKEQTKKILSKFDLLGQVCAKVLVDGRILDMEINPLLFQMAMGRKLFLEDIEAIDQELGKQMLKLQHSLDDSIQCKDTSARLDGAVIEDLCLSFQLPGYSDYDLVENGKQISVTSENLQQYIYLLTEATVGKGVQQQVDAFKEGFQKVFPLRYLKIFYGGEICELIGGSRYEKWSIEKLFQVVKFDHGYTMQHRIARYLLEVMSDFSQEEQSRFLNFVTGCPRLPPGGFASLPTPLTVVRKVVLAAQPSQDEIVQGFSPVSAGKQGLIDWELPSVMTCANYIKLPEYSSKHVLKQRIMYALKEGQQSFDLS